MALVGWPSPLSDDTGSGQNGTVVNKAMIDAMEASIEGYVVSATNPTIFPWQIIDEVKLARGSMPSLDARLDVSINENGTLKASAVSGALGAFRNFGLVNLLGNDTFLIWQNGDAAAPAYYTLAGAGGTIARTGNGLGDTNRKHNSFAAKLTSGGGADVTLTQTLISGADFAVSAFRNRFIAFGVRAKTSSAGAAAVLFFDGVNTTISNLHTGSGVSGPEGDGWEWLFGVHQVSPSATQFQVILRGNSGGTVTYWSGATAVFADVAPVDWVPANVTRRSLKAFLPGNQAAGNGKHYFHGERPGIVQNVAVSAVTAPTVSAQVWDYKTWDGAAFTSMLTGNLSIAATQVSASKSPPDGTYARRCLDVQAGTTFRTGAVIRVDLITDDGGNTAADNIVSIDYDTYDRPLDQIRAL